MHNCNTHKGQQTLDGELGTHSIGKHTLQALDKHGDRLLS